MNFISFTINFLNLIKLNITFLQYSSMYTIYFLKLILKITSLNNLGWHFILKVEI